jgi:hypothetical protein
MHASFSIDLCVHEFPLHSALGRGWGSMHRRTAAVLSSVVQSEVIYGREHSALIVTVLQAITSSLLPLQPIERLV